MFIQMLRTLSLSSLFSAYLVLCSGGRTSDIASEAPSRTYLDLDLRPS